MQAVFRALQTRKWGGVLFRSFFNPPPEETVNEQPALLFPFHLHERDRNDEGRYFLVEYNTTGRFLRITIEDAGASRLQLKHIRHRVVDQAVISSYLPDVYLTAEQIHQGIIRECMNNRDEYREIPEHQPDLFDHLRRGGLPELEALHFRWPTDDIQMLLLEKRENTEAPNDSLQILMKEIQLLEDPYVLSCLARGGTVEMTSGDFSVYFDISRFGACLNVSFDTPRSVPALDLYLNSMPILARAVRLRENSLKGVRLFLIHHITAEVLALIKSFADAGCSSLTTFFVKYAGIVPETYLETLLSLPAQTFRFFSLQKLESRLRLAGRYSFSRQFGPLAGLDEIGEALVDEAPDFLGAMRLASGHIFLRDTVKARSRGE
jgi:hypothetical protein